MKKPDHHAIRAEVRLSLRAPYRPDPCVCSVCGVAVDPSDLPCTAYLECDESDTETAVLVFIGPKHAECLKVLNAHPRLYVRSPGEPGGFPLLCGPCVHRDGLACRHDDLTANGGGGSSCRSVDRPAARDDSVRARGQHRADQDGSSMRWTL